MSLRRIYCDFSLNRPLLLSIIYGTGNFFAYTRVLTHTRTHAHTHTRVKSRAISFSVGLNKDRAVGKLFYFPRCFVATYNAIMNKGLSFAIVPSNASISYKQCLLYTGTTTKQERTEQWRTERRMSRHPTGRAR